MRRLFGLGTPRVALLPTPFLRRASGDVWEPPLVPQAWSASSPISAGQTYAPVNTVTNQDDLHELVNKIRFLASMGGEDRPLILEVCDRASTDATAREAIRALMHEFKHGSAAAQLSAARLWAILLRNSSAAFITQSTAADFLETIEALVRSPQTSPIIRDRVLHVLGDAVYSNPTREPFRLLWMAVKPEGEPDQGSPYNAHDAVLRSSGRSRPNRSVSAILDRISPPIPQAPAVDSRFPFEWEEPPPPSYETATTGTFSSFSTATTFSSSSQPDNDLGVVSYGSNESVFRSSEMVARNHARHSRDEDVDMYFDPWEGNGSSGSWTLVRSAAQAALPASPRSMSPVRPPILEITPPSPPEPLRLQNSSTNASSSSPSPNASSLATVRPTAIRQRLPLVHGGSRANLAPPVASSSRGPAAPQVPYGSRQRNEGIYTHTLRYLKSVASRNNHSSALISLDGFKKVMGELSTVSCLVYASQYRDTLVQVSADLGVADHPRLQTALDQDQAAIADTLLDVLYSPPDERAVLALEGDAAQSLLDIVQHTLDSALLHTRDATSKARRLIGKLAKTCDKLPSSLTIFGVTQRDEHASFAGGFGDVFKAMYQGKPVALKHMRMFQAADQRDIRRKFYREALVWKRLRHSYIVPLIGIDTESFPSSFCMVSPWMKNGTVIKYLTGIGEANRRSTVNRLIREIVQGLAYLHDQNVVHGDLRGSNILVDDAGHACLTDFGLTVLSDATTTQTNNGAGSVRWMAPETLDPSAYGLQNHLPTTASDIYAFGCLCLELYTGFPPFHEAFLHDAPVMFSVMSGARPNRPAGDLIPDQIWNIMQQCWSHDYAERPSILGIVLGLAIHEPLSGTATQNLEVDVAVDEDDAWVTPAAEQRYEGWVASVVAPLSGFIDKSVNPRDHYLDLGEIGEGRGGTTVSVARLAERHRDHLDLPEHVKEKDQHDLLARNTTFVAIKSVPIMPSDSTKLWDVLRELRIMHGIRCDNILGLDALYIDPVEDTLWIRMELMERTLSSVIELNGSGVVLSDQIIAGCTKDILAALENLRVNDIAPRNIRSDNILINKHGVLKLTNVSNAVRLSAQSSTSNINPASIVSDSRALAALVWEMAAGRRPPIDTSISFDDWPPLPSSPPRSPSFSQFIRTCFDPSVTRFGFSELIDSPFIRDACERPTLAQLLLQCTAFEGRHREQRTR